jgi:acetyl-CoA acyltransferase
VPDAVIVDAVRTPLGRRNGALSDWHPADLAAETLKAIAERNSLDPVLVDDVIMGCVSQVGDQTWNIGRNAVLGAGWPESVPGVTIDRQCGSSQQSVHFAAQGVMAGAYDVAIAAGVESMTRVPMGSSAAGGKPFGERMRSRYHDQLIPQGLSAEMIAERWDIPREELDGYAFESQARALTATEEGRFDNEIVPIEVKNEGSVTTLKRDEGIRPSTTREGLAALEPAF